MRDMVTASAQNIFLEILEVFLKVFKKNFHTTLFENFLPNGVSRDAHVKTSLRVVFWGVFPAPGQADFLQQRHLRHWAENFQKVWYEKIF